MRQRERRMAKCLRSLQTRGQECGIMMQSAEQQGRPLTLMHHWKEIARRDYKYPCAKQFHSWLKMHYNGSVCTGEGYVPILCFIMPPFVYSEMSMSFDRWEPQARGADFMLSSLLWIIGVLWPDNSLIQGILSSGNIKGMGKLCSGAIHQGARCIVSGRFIE